MPAVTATAPGKIILFGEHAVVYARPAIAVPIRKVRARVVISPDPKAASGNIHIEAPDVGIEGLLSELQEGFSYKRAIDLVVSKMGIQHVPACSIRITSTIPISSGLGSGTAVSVALIKAFSNFLGLSLTNEIISSLAFEVDKLYHGTPSGIDNTVITYSKPVYYIMNKTKETLILPHSFVLIIADTGVASHTADSVGDVRTAWEKDPKTYEVLFDAIGDLVDDARGSLETGDIETLGNLMNKNQELLRAIKVSSQELENLIQGALSAGAFGAKLSGGGRGGYMIALTHHDVVEKVNNALFLAGAKNSIITVI